MTLAIKKGTAAMVTNDGFHTNDSLGITQKTNLAELNLEESEGSEIFIGAVIKRNN